MEGKIRDLSEIMIAPSVYDDWFATAEGKIRRLMASGISPDTRVTNEQFVEHPDGSGEIFCYIGDERISMPVAVGKWALYPQN